MIVAAVLRVGSETISYVDPYFAALDFVGVRGALEKAVDSGTVSAYAINEIDGSYRTFLLTAGVPVSFYTDGPVPDRVTELLNRG